MTLNLISRPADEKNIKTSALSGPAEYPDFRPA